MEFENIKELINLVNSSDLAFFELSNGNDHIKMDKSFNRGVSDTNLNNTKTINSPVVSIATSENIPVKKEEVKKVEKEVAQEKEDDENTSVITSPMVGTFYSSASPESPAFVKVGDEISKGKIICIIEAMKLMNEIESEFDGTIVKCLVNDGDMVEYGQPLFKIKGE
ncbi:acetyl-CoA carboxylase biotin carboxyl carrier protein [Clostridium saccharobutylicum]|uniref:Biotin carboxyl carrier protein of acetyl-CoA carboxylase n=1 Tax=Clostridium saccharobutylicum DSM 13864 TaxID=1345695 RepID=U5MS91_CLOSA|nr:acetyl-CoA carboxylase biotin carboxyl carrier protein [Clostridium saccharobutylicum]AGX42317.1 biotin carboxyl carrier protein of acetyl-CoA carboxylase AccB [Clostridium saccharobutylicum DSM 13864]AQR89598.1 biotin carboxyl carrier protein of acetyl-CoA carboxylase [Clostridium saccharobutylicum]AQR99500.1 biotin carboxyl carrier protein of acetyl-CoA carboxylase [Clostridium saccharobutylicum]AQS13486.1 biotin carboxyl carrier protein of acetyl-CoA carboxylase [Clostridium saccharobutyl